MPASQAGRRRFDPGRPLHSFSCKSEQLATSSENREHRDESLSPTYHPQSAEVEPHRASVRSLDGEILGSTDASTICWAPRKPSALAAYDERGREHVIRCGWCGGCREFDRRRLAKRLVAHYREFDGDLWLVIPCALSFQSNLCARLHRNRLVEFDPGFYRLGASEVALVVRGAKPNVHRVRALERAGAKVFKVQRSRGERGWRPLTVGILRSRDEYGEQTKRFYHRGLPKAERERWSVTTRGGIRKRHPELGVGVRAFDGRASIYPPEAWRPFRLARRRGPIERRISKTTPIASVLENMMPRLAGTTLEIRPLSPRGGAAHLMTGSRASRNFSSPNSRPLNSIKGASYASSLQLSQNFYSEWAERMRKKALNQAPDQ